MFLRFDSQEDRRKYGGSCFIELQFCKLPFGTRINRSVNNRSKTKQKSRYLKVASTFLFGLQADFYQIELSRVRVVWKFNLSLFIQIFRRM